MILKRADIYKQKIIWKRLLLLFAFVIVIISLYFVNSIVKHLAANELRAVEIWADAVQRKAVFVNYTNHLFKKIEEEERRRVELWAEAMKKLIRAGLDEDVTFYTKIIQNNKTIPVILTDAQNRIITGVNLDFAIDTVKVLKGKLLEEYITYNPIYIYDYRGRYVQNILYYKESTIYADLKKFLNEIVDAYFSEILNNSPGMPIVVTDSSQRQIITTGNIDSTILKNSDLMIKKIASMKSNNEPLLIKLMDFPPLYIFYEESFALKQLRYYPLILFAIITVFVLIAYVLFSISRNAEQNQVWIGMARETAHQLGTPISSMLAWIEILRQQHNAQNNEIIKELEKDVTRLQHIADRFSKIGSQPEFQLVSLNDLISEAIDYIQKRSPISIKFVFNISETFMFTVNKQLFLWAIENILKNAVDSVEQHGIVEVNLSKNKVGNIIIDISDTGKGIQKSHYRRIFMPGYTTKKRGWGLGLTLTKRIIEQYHEGKIFVRKSTLGKGTTFRIILYK